MTQLHIVTGAFGYSGKYIAARLLNVPPNKFGGNSRCKSAQADSLRATRFIEFTPC
ncbi:MAG: hypothetical protein AB1817_13690 [Chloroflexota bacterium]